MFSFYIALYCVLDHVLYHDIATLCCVLQHFLHHDIAGLYCASHERWLNNNQKHNGRIPTYTGLTPSMKGTKKRDQPENWVRSHNILISVLTQQYSVSHNKIPFRFARHSKTLKVRILDSIFPARALQPLFLELMVKISTWTSFDWNLWQVY